MRLGPVEAHRAHARPGARAGLAGAHRRQRRLHVLFCTVAHHTVPEFFPPGWTCVACRCGPGTRLCDVQHRGRHAPMPTATAPAISPETTAPCSRAPPPPRTSLRRFQPSAFFPLSYVEVVPTKPPKPARLSPVSPTIPWSNPSIRSSRWGVGRRRRGVYVSASNDAGISARQSLHIMVYRKLVVFLRGGSTQSPICIGKDK